MGEAPVTLCAQLIGGAWIEWHRIAAGEWHTAGIVRPLPAIHRLCGEPIASLGSWAISTRYRLI